MVEKCQKLRIYPFVFAILYAYCSAHAYFRKWRFWHLNSPHFCSPFYGHILIKYRPSILYVLQHQQATSLVTCYCRANEGAIIGPAADVSYPNQHVKKQIMPAWAPELATMALMSEIIGAIIGPAQLQRSRYISQAVTWSLHSTCTCILFNINHLIVSLNL